MEPSAANSKIFISGWHGLIQPVQHGLSDMLPRMFFTSRIEGRVLIFSLYLVCNVVDIHHKADLHMAKEALCICRTLLYVFLPKPCPLSDLKQTLSSDENKMIWGRGQLNVECLAIKPFMN